MSLFITIILTFILIILILYYFFKVKKDLPFIGILDAEWAIGIVRLNFKSHKLIAIQKSDLMNPIIKSSDLKLKDAQFVADPFLVAISDKYFIFYEIMRSKGGVIGVSESLDLINWEFKGIVLEEKFHLSYPYIFNYENNFYMIPESAQKGEVRLYIAEDFPKKWKYIKTILKGKEWFDSSLIRWGDYWYIFTNIHNNTLEIYYSSNLFGDWYPHSKNPIISCDYKNSRPAGQFLYINGMLIRFAQNGSLRYGSEVNAYKIITLSTTEYSEIELENNPILYSSLDNWNSAGMHHISPLNINNDMIAAVDGNRFLKEPVLFFFNKRIKISERTYKLITRIKRAI